MKREHGLTEDVIKAREDEEREQVDFYLFKVKEFEQIRKDPTSTFQQGLEASKEILLLNPEYYTAWNYRKQKLMENLSKVGTIEFAKAEFAFSVEGIKINPKSYPSWHHRKWLIENIFAPKGSELYTKFDYSYELKLCSKLLDLDSRNCNFS